MLHRLQQVSSPSILNTLHTIGGDAIVTALQLLSRYLITPESEKSSITECLLQLEQNLIGGVRLLQFCANTLSVDDYQATATKVMKLCQQYKAKVLLNTSLFYKMLSGILP